jgi:tetratricopeptide (TPR) repeat protein
MKLIIKYILLFGFTCGILFSQDKPADPKALELFIQGKSYELQDNYLAAIRLYNEALKIEKAPGIYYTLSRLYYNVSQYDNALDNGIRALNLAPGNTDYEDNLADVCIMLEDYSNALKYLKMVTEKKPDDINVLYNIGRVYEALKQPSEAIKYYEKITEDYEYDETVLERMVAIYEGYKDYANSAATMEKVLTLNPSDLNLKYSIANEYLKIPDYDDALRIYKDILEQNPKNRDVQTEIIKIYFRTGRNDLAFDEFGKLADKDSVDFGTKMGVAIAFFDASRDDSTALPVAKSILENLNAAYPAEWMPQMYLAFIDARENNFGIADQQIKKSLEASADTSSEAYILAGFFYFEQNRLDEALGIFRKGVTVFPEDFRLNFLTGNTLYRQTKERESLPYLEKALSLFPQDMNTISTLGIIYDDLNMDDDCDKLYMQAFKFYPDNILLLNNYAYHLSERGVRLQEALEMSKKTIEKEPDNASYLDTYGWIYYKLKDYKNAKKYIEKAVKLGSNPTLLLHLGDVYEGMGDIVSALKYWNQGLKEDPDNKDLLYKIDKYK